MSGVVRVSACLSCSLAALLLALPASAQRKPERLVDRRVGSRYPRVAASGSAVYVVWTGEGIFFSRSLDGGDTWLDQDVEIDTAPSGAFYLFPQIAISGASIYTTWVDVRSGTYDIRFNRSLDGGINWLAPDVQLDTDPANVGESISPQIAAAGSSVYVTWEEIGSSSTGDVYFNFSSDRGTTFLPVPLQIDRGSWWANSEYPRIAASGSAVYVAWQDGRNGASDIYFNRSLDGGRTWLNNDVRLDTDAPGAAFSGTVAIAASGASVWVAWEDGRNGWADIYCNRSSDGGATWLPSDVRLDTDAPGSADSSFPQIADSGATVHVVWQDARSGYDDIHWNRSTDGGVTWLAQDVRLDTDPAGAATSGYPRIAVSGSTVYVTWQDARDGADDIRFNRSLDGGTTWLSNDRRFDTDPPGASFSGWSDITASGPWVYAVWSDDRGFGDVYCNVPFALATYGDGKAGSCGVVPQCVASGTPVLGHTITLDVTNVLGNTAGALLAGGPGAKVVDPGIWFQGGWLYLVPALAPFIGPLGGFGCGTGTLSVPLQIPLDPAFVGADLYFQPVFLDPRAPFGWSAANAVELWIG